MGHCYDTDGSYNCKCPYGFKLQNNTCIDIDECSNDSSLCQNGSCKNTNGTFYCECNPGFKASLPDRRHCLDVDECKERDNSMDTPICGPVGSKCQNIAGSFICYCPRGYTKTVDEKSCEDVDECSLKENICGEYGKCYNTHGGFRCECMPGFILAPSGTECIHSKIDKCWRTCTGGPTTQTVITINPLDNITTRPSSNEDTSETPYNPSNSTHDPNKPGLFTTLSPWILGDSTTRATIPGIKEDDPNEINCDYQTKECTKPACCCQCMDNAWGSDDDSNSDFGDLCPKPGTQEFNKLCPRGCGKTPSPTGGDKDLDECELNPDHTFCPEGTCVNREGGYRCECNAGFTTSDDLPNTCLDIDECKMDENICGRYADLEHGNNGCINTEGSYKCICKEGYHTSHKSPYCVDIDECAFGGGANCVNRCENTSGGYKCLCPRGFKSVKDPHSFTVSDSCENINECEKEPSICPSNNMECIDTIGSYRCECKPGSELVGGICIDIDECNVHPSLQPCGKRGVCSNLPMNFYECKCNSGYTPSDDKRSCQDNRIGTCFLKYHARYGLLKSVNIETHVTKDQCCCSVGQGWKAQTFSNVPTDNVDNVEKCPVYGSAEWRELCPFGRGFSKHGNDINDCEIIPRACNTNIEPGTGMAGNCINQAPSYQCICMNGFQATSDGKDCEDVDECLYDYMNECSSHSTCKNSVGSYECICDKGYKLIGDTLCADIDECTERGIYGHNCHDVCINTEGGFRCDCSVGYELTGKYLFIFHIFIHISTQFSDKFFL